MWNTIKDEDATKQHATSVMISKESQDLSNKLLRILEKDELRLTFRRAARIIYNALLWTWTAHQRSVDKLKNFWISEQGMHLGFDMQSLP